MTFTHRKGTTKVYMLRYTKTDLTLHIKEVLHNDTIDCKTKDVYKKDFYQSIEGFDRNNNVQESVEEKRKVAK
ncbi:hypothetical protein ABW636_20460 [Aquimarina sp. 2201CG1-2-11]|uniref:hypothetical protein n=1 Tax=Aquimarina discodermiae TaxID=3231043 RepID=UPI003462AF5D